MASRLAVPVLCLTPPEASMIKPVGVCTPQYTGCRAIGSAASPALRRRTLAPASSPVAALSVPGFGLAKARGRSARGSRHAHDSSSSASTWIADKLRSASSGVQTAVHDCKERFRYTHDEVVKSLQPPTHVRAAWNGEQPAPNWMVWAVVAGYFTGLLFLIAAFAGAPVPDCALAPTSPIIQKAHIVIMGALMFAAGALLAVEHPVTWMTLIL